MQSPNGRTGHHDRAGRWGLPGAAILVALVASLLAGCGEDGLPDDLAVYRVTVDHCTGVERSRVTAVAIDEDLAATVAHSFIEVDTVEVQATDGTRTPAEIVYLDQDKDIALLRLAGTHDRALTVAEPVEGAAVTIISFSSEDGPEVKEATVLDLVDATLDGAGRRSAAKLEADIGPGDSGAPVVDGDGRMVAMVFATARGQDVGWAVTGSEITAAVEAVNGNRPEDEPPAC